MKNVIAALVLLGLHAPIGHAQTFTKVATFGDTRFLHETDVSVAVVLPTEVRTVSKGRIWRWSKRGKLLGKVALKPCSAAHGGAVRDAAFSSDGATVLVHCLGEGEHALFDVASGKRLAKVGDFGQPQFCGSHFYGIRPFTSGLRMVAPRSRKVATLMPRSSLSAMACRSGRPVVIDERDDLVFLDESGKEAHRIEGRFVRLARAPGGLAAVRTQEVDLLLVDERGSKTVGAVSRSYLDVPQYVAMPSPDRIVLWDRGQRRDHVRVLDRRGAEVFATSPNVTGVLFDADAMWVVSGPRIDSYRLRDGWSNTASVLNRALDYYQADLRMSSSRVLWSKVKEEWVALDVDTGALKHRYMRPDSHGNAERDAVMTNGQVATIASGDKVRLLGLPAHNTVFDSGLGDIRNGRLVTDRAGARLALVDLNMDRRARIATWESVPGKPAIHTLDKTLTAEKIASVHLRGQSVWLLPAVGHTTVYRLDTKTGVSQTLELAGGTFWARDVSVRDGKVIAVGFDVPFVIRQGRARYLKNRKLRVYRPDGKTLAKRTPPRGVDLVEATRIGLVPATGEVWLMAPEKNHLWIFDPELKRVVFTTRIPEAAGRGMSVTFSPDGQAFATQYHNGRIEVWRR